VTPTHETEVVAIAAAAAADDVADVAAGIVVRRPVRGRSRLFRVTLLCVTLLCVTLLCVTLRGLPLLGRQRPALLRTSAAAVSCGDVADSLCARRRAT
jgi:hypothetical protein